MHIRRYRFWISLTGALALAALGWLVGPTAVAHADEFTVCPAGPGTCDYANIQDAVDAAQDGDVIKIAAGQYTDLHIRPRHDISATGYVTQVVYISKSLTLRGGYTSSFTEAPDPIAQPTILDAGGRGRAVYITGAVSPTLEGLQLTGGDAGGLGGGGSPGSVQDGGGGLYVITATATLSGCQVFSNTATMGGGLLLYRSGATIAGSRVFSNTATQGGGGVYLFESDALLHGNTITHNIALYSQGGGIYLLRSGATLSDNMVRANTSRFGGGAYLQSSAATLTRNDFTDNNAGSSGGGAYLDNSGATLSGNNFVSNDAGTHGGGLFLTSSSKATVKHNTVLSNTTHNWGGGVHILNSGIPFHHNTVRANTGGARGGGVYLEGSAATLGENIFAENQATGDGGALYFRASNASLRNNIIADNQANNAGGGMYAWSANVTLKHNTIARNTSGDGVGIFTEAPASAKHMTLMNTILVSHTTGISVTQGCTVTLAGTLWGEGAWANGQNWGGAGHVTHTLDYTGTPDFVAPEAGNYHIGLGSAAINRAIDLGIDQDIDGQARPQGDGYEIGADEVGLLVTKVATPTALHSGEALTYTIHVTNTSNVTLTATITDFLPDDVTPNGQLIWTTEITAPGGVWVQPIYVTVNAGYTGTLDNVVQVATAQGPTGVTTNTVEVGITRALAVTQHAQPDPVQAGQRLTFTLCVTNVGNIALQTIVTDTLPEHIQPGFVDGKYVRPGDVLTWTAGLLTPTQVWRKAIAVRVAWGYSGTVTNQMQAAGVGGGEGAHEASVTAKVTPALDFTQLTNPTSIVQAGERMTYTLWVQNVGNVNLTAAITDTLPDQVTTTDQTTWHGQVIVAPGGGWVRTIGVNVALNYAGPLTNVVTITTEEGVGGVYTQTTQAQLTPALSVAKRASAERVAAGERITYTIQVTNTGNMDLHATITDILPEHVTTGDQIEWTDQFLPARGAPWQRTVVVDTALGYGGPLTNVVQVTTAEGATGVHSVASQSLITPALRITKHAGNTSLVAPGDAFSYTLVYSNTGTDSAYNVIIHDQLPDEVAFVTCNPSPCYEVGGQVTWERGTVPPGTQSSVTVRVEAQADSGGQTATNADYTIQSDRLSPSETQSGGPVEIQILNPDLHLVKTASLQFFEGANETIYYTLTCKNNGSGMLTGVVITDELSANSLFQSASPQCTHNGSGTGGVVTCDIGTLAQGESDAVQIEVLTGSDESDIINQAEGDSDQTSPQTSSATVLYNDGCFQVIQTGIEISDHPAIVGQTVYFTGTYTPTLANDTSFGGPVTFDWVFGGPGTASGTDGQTETYTYAEAGTYMVTLTVDNLCPEPPSQDTRRINVISGAEPDIVLIDDAFDMSLAPGETDQRTLIIGNVGGADLEWELSESPPVGWLDVTPIQGTVTSSASADVILDLDATDLSEGDYSTTLEINSNDPGEPSVTVTVHLRVTEKDYGIYLPLVFKGFTHP